MVVNQLDFMQSKILDSEKEIFVLCLSSLRSEENYEIVKVSLKKSSNISNLTVSSRAPSKLLDNQGNSQRSWPN